MKKEVETDGDNGCSGAGVNCEVSAGKGAEGWDDDGNDGVEDAGATADDDDDDDDDGGRGTADTCSAARDGLRDSHSAILSFKSWSYLSLTSLIVAILTFGEASRQRLTRIS